METGAGHSGAKRAGYGPTTCTELVLLAQEQQTPEQAQAALAELCRLYWQPLHVFLRCHWGARDADDLAQGFIADLLTRGIQTYDPTRRHFRRWLRGAAWKYACRVWKRERVGIRDVRRRRSWDALDPVQRLRVEPRLFGTPERLFDRSVAVCLVEQALHTTRDAYAARGQSQRFELLERYIPGAELADLEYARAGAALGLREDAVRKAVKDLRDTYRSNLRRHARLLVPRDADVDEELRHLLDGLYAMEPA